MIPHCLYFIQVEPKFCVFNALWCSGYYCKGELSRKVATNYRYDVTNFYQTVANGFPSSKVMSQVWNKYNGKTIRLTYSSILQSVEESVTREGYDSVWFVKPTNCVKCMCYKLNSVIQIERSLELSKSVKLVHVCVRTFMIRKENFQFVKVLPTFVSMKVEIQLFIVTGKPSEVYNFPL